MDISGNDLKVLCFFIKYNNFMKQMYFSINYIAMKTKLSKRTVQTCLATLRNKNVISWIQRENKTNLYTLNDKMLKKRSGKNYHEVNTNNLLNNTIQKQKGDKGVKYVRTEILSKTIQTIVKRTNIFYRAKVNENNKITNKQRLEKYAWKFISEMDKDKREVLMNKLTDPIEWNKFLQKMKTIIVYKQGRKINR